MTYRPTMGAYGLARDRNDDIINDRLHALLLERIDQWESACEGVYREKSLLFAVRDRNDGRLLVGSRRTRRVVHIAPKRGTGAKGLFMDEDDWYLAKFTGRRGLNFCGDLSDDWHLELEDLGEGDREHIDAIAVGFYDPEWTCGPRGKRSVVTWTEGDDEPCYLYRLLTRLMRRLSLPLGDIGTRARIMAEWSANIMLDLDGKDGRERFGGDRIEWLEDQIGPLGALRPDAYETFNDIWDNALNARAAKENEKQEGRPTASEQ